MNIKFLVFISFLIALLCHLVIFNFCTVVFSIDPAAPKPKFFFLGPILKQNDVKQAPLKERSAQPYAASNAFDSTKNSLKDIHYETADTEKNPFAIRAIKKPLIPQTTQSQEKINIKSTFETSPQKDTNIETEPQRSTQELKIQPYRSLQSRSPKNILP